MTLRINPVTYRWNGLWNRPNDERLVVGVIGQELERIAPYAVGRSIEKFSKGDMETELVTVNVQPLIYLLVNSVLQLEARVQALREKRKGKV